MAKARIFPDPIKYKAGGADSSLNEESNEKFSAASLSYARTIIKYAPQRGSSSIRSTGYGSCTDIS